MKGSERTISMKRGNSGGTSAARAREHPAATNSLARADDNAGPSRVVTSTFFIAH
jgi:hypothetical protein